MGRSFQNRKRVSSTIKVFGQYAEIKKMYGNISYSEFKKDGFLIVLNVTPSENSATYVVEISYRSGYRPKAILLSPELEQRDGQAPHHTYGRDKRGYPILCVYCPYMGEWNPDMSIATSFIPWVSTWLNTYEYWLITGEWHYDEVKAGESPSD